MTKQFDGKRVLVTGASSGMGEAIAVTFAGHGAMVAVHARSIDKAQRVIAKIHGTSGRAIPVVGDLADENAVAQLCEKTLNELGSVDIVVNNAGMCEKGSTSELSVDSWHKTMQINLTAPFLISKYLAPAMKERGAGCFIFNASIAAHLADPEGAAYCASKAGLLGLMRCLAAELGPSGIRVNAMCPGWVDTPMAVSDHKRIHAESTKSFDEFYDQSIRQNLLNARVTPQDVANLAVFLAGDQARNITAQSFNVCAGAYPS